MMTLLEIYSKGHTIRYNMDKVVYYQMYEAEGQKYIEVNVCFGKDVRSMTLEINSHASVTLNERP